MLMKQISVFIENKPSRLAEVTGFLAEEGINIHALSIADTTDFGILRMIVSDPDLAKSVLKQNGLTVKTTGVVAVAMEHSPGGLHKILTELERLNINIEYMYAFTSRPTDAATVILRLDNQDESIEKLKDSDIRLLDASLLEKLNDNN